MKDKLKIIAFDADDTLWVNEPYFRENELKFAELMAGYMSQDEILQIMFQTEMKNLKLYGYGVKGFMLSMIEAANLITGGKADAAIINKIIALGQDQLQKPVELLDGVEEVLQHLQGKYKLVVATKGDLLDQQRKVKSSGLQDYFHHVEVMSDKKAADYSSMLKKLSCTPSSFLMLGNSMKSDVLPVLELDGYASHIPYHITWAHELHDEEPQHPNYIKLANIREILGHLD
ncbi:putative hydrolase of the HAD superfamily [Chitinophaga jiangningensis]|uniref:Putative hydrolase of the HAD superfamily n=1 Tax=Chitinophaga jiangningensis TaxID=1419482 RepID=A0A1M6Y8G3_9BACT|nr:HAD family hydrolase [Chitinophaga jiangningensis]SHL14527.1 putative hydrolase of the HAD superfamily [Chitinophaga jiangningensis]